jgi:hypothetical protein
MSLPTVDSVRKSRTVGRMTTSLSQGPMRPWRWVRSGAWIRLGHCRPADESGNTYIIVAICGFSRFVVEPARGLWTNLGRLPLRVFSIGKYAFQKNKICGA